MTRMLMMIIMMMMIKSISIKRKRPSTGCVQRKIFAEVDNGEVSGKLKVGEVELK